MHPTGDTQGSARPIVGLMMSRNEVDIIAEVLESWRRFDVPIIALDDSEDGTYDVLRASSHVTVLRQRERYPQAERGPLDWMYQTLLEEKRKRFGVDTWVMLALADELWLHHPRKIAAAMAVEGAQTLRCRMCNHLLHPEDRTRWDFDRQVWRPEAQARPLRERMPWYTAEWFEHRGFLDHDTLSYKPRTRSGMLPMPKPEPEFSRWPLIAHHSIRSPVQAIARAQDRVERDYQPAYEPYYYRRQVDEVFYSEFPALNVRLQRFDGSYGEHGRGLEDLE